MDFVTSPCSHRFLIGRFVFRRLNSDVCMQTFVVRLLKCGSLGATVRTGAYGCRKPQWTMHFEMIKRREDMLEKSQQIIFEEMLLSHLEYSNFLEQHVLMTFSITFQTHKALSGALRFVASSPCRRSPRAPR